VVVAMGVRGHILPVYRRWATFIARSPETHVAYSLHRFCCIVPSVERRSGTSTRPLSITGQGRGPLVSGGQCRYLSNFDRGSDDDDSTDLREQKSAFLRALEGNKPNNGNKDGQRNKSSKSKTPREQRDIGKSRKKNNTIHRKGENQRDSKATISSPSKKVTLDEFFSNLEKTKAEELSPKPRTRKRSRARISSNQGKIGNPEPRTPSNDSNRKSQGAPAADMGSFFDEVNALMDRQAKEKEELHSTTVTRTKNGIGSSDSALNSRPSISDIIPPTPMGNDSDILDDGNSIGYNCSIESWDQYIEMVDEIIEGPKFLAKFQSKRNESKSDDEAEKARQIREVVEWLNSKTPLVEINLPTLEFALSGELSNASEESENKAIESGDDDEIMTGTNSSYTSRRHLFREELDAQKELFLNNLGWTKKQYELATGALVAMGNLCAKNCNAPPLDVAWSKLKELGYPMKNKDVLHNYLYVASTFSLPKRRFTLAGDRFNDDEMGGDGSSPSVMDLLYGSSDMSSGVGSSDELEDEIDLSAEVALCHDFLHEATEQSTGIHVRRLVQFGRANEAEALLEATMKSDDLRLRTYAPIYQKYLEQGDVSSAFKLFVKMKERKNVTLQTETYIQLIACIAENGFFRADSNEIDGIEEFPYSTKAGPSLFDVLASELADHSVEITSASAKRLYNAFERGFRSDDSQKNLRPLNLLESLRTDNEVAESDDLIVSRVRLDESTGKCPRSGSQLRLINLDPTMKERFQEGLLHLVSTSYQERHRNAAKRDVHGNLRKFGEWLQSRKGKPFTAIIDGPNIAYYMQNFEQGTFNYHQIKFVVDALENMGENVLVVLPKKYTYDRFPIPKGTHTIKQSLSQKEKEIRDDLIAKGKACVVPVGTLDDYYWMYASVSMKEEFIPPDNTEGRWPGNRPMLISNDKLRDHKMSLLEPRLFRRWYSNFLVNFTFSAFVGDECTDKEIGFKTADFYSREIQGNASNPNEMTWHFPVSDWDENESLCIRIPKKGI